MKTFMEEARHLPVISEPDVLVVGAGPAGMGAAIAAARNGARTMIIDRCGFPGGNLTNAMINPIFTFHDCKGRRLIDGIAGEIVKRLVDLGCSDGHVSDLTFDNASMTPFDPEGMKIVLFRMISESKCQLRLHTQFTDVIRQDRHIKAIIVESKSGREVILPRTVIDCSGDGDVAAKAGCSFTLGAEDTGLMQPVSIFFRIGGVNNENLRKWMKDHRELLKDAPTDEEIDTQKEISFLGLNDLVHKEMQSGKYPIQAANRILFYQLPRKDQVSVNATRLQNIDGTNADDLTRAEHETREQVWIIHRFLQDHVGGFENSCILDTGSVVGVRETRHIHGDYTIQLDDVLNETHFEDGIACGSFAVDIHPPTGQKQIYTGSGKVVYEIPYRSLLPLGIDNLWLAGRCISATHAASGSIRVMATCIAMGQGAGTAAAIAVRNQIANRVVNIENLRALLLDQGQYLLQSGREDPIDSDLIMDRKGEKKSFHYNPF